MPSKANQPSDSSTKRFRRHKQLHHTIRMICLDIDGTLLDSESKLRDSVRDAVKRANLAGVHIVLATGRNLDSTLPIANSLGVKVSIISSVGAHLRAADGHTTTNPLSRRQALRVVHIGLQFDSGLFIDHPDCSWTLGNQTYVSMYSHVNNGTPAESKSIRRTLTPAPLKISIINNKSVLQEIRSLISQGFPELQMASPFETVVDITSKDVNKGTTLRHLADLTGIPLDQVAAVGDSENDIPNFMVSGLSISMENAPKGVRATTDWLAPSNDNNGVVWVIDQILASNHFREM